MRVAAYIRVSTDKQAEEGYSIAAQRERLKAYAYSQGWEIVQFYVDEGVSAKDMKRPELQRMIKDMKNKLFDIVLVHKLDRLTRSVIDLDKLLKLFNEHNVKFKSATEIYDTTTATGRLFIRLVASMAQWERENLSERISIGMEQKAREGKWTVSIPPFGYNRDGDYLVINEQEAAVVRKIFELYTSGKYGMGKIAKYLNTKTNFRTKTGSEWNGNSIRYILTNPIYIGTMRYNFRVNKENYFEKENVAPKIIDEETFDQAQKILNQRTNSHPKKATSPYIFTSVLKCARCGGRMNGKMSTTKRNGKKYISYGYYCVNKRINNCDLPNIAQNHLEHQFLKIVDQWIIDNDIVHEAITSTQQDDENKKQIRQIKKELEEIEKRRKKWQYGWANGLLTDEDLIARNREEDEKEKLLREELKKLTNNVRDNVDIKALREALMDLRESWPFLDVHEKKHVVNIAVKSLTVDKNPNLQGKPESVIITDIEYYS